jgi:hypothetical protein
MHDYSANLKNAKSLSLSVNNQNQIQEQIGEDEEEVIEEPEII